MVKHTQTIRRQQPTNCLSVFDDFVRLALIGLFYTKFLLTKNWRTTESSETTVTYKFYRNSLINFGKFQENKQQVPFLSNAVSSVWNLKYSFTELCL